MIVFFVKKSCRALRHHHVVAAPFFFFFFFFFVFFFFGQNNLTKAFSAVKNFSLETEMLMQVQRLTESMVEDSTMVI